MSKHQAPLRYQFERGQSDFYKGRTSNPFPNNTDQHKEWARGFDFAYFDNLKKVKGHESKHRAGSKAMAYGEV